MLMPADSVANCSRDSNWLCRSGGEKSRIAAPIPVSQLLRPLANRWKRSKAFEFGEMMDAPEPPD